MCGFCGYVNKNENISNDKLIKKMNNTLKLRGPNDNGVYIDKKTALGHTRLSIIDVEYGKQPMIKTTKDNTYVIVYNGELYNTDTLRDDLIKKGYTFNTKCDTEVILTSYIEYGANSILNFNGIFSFAIYDIKNEKVFLGRDRLGIKPLYYTFTTTPSPSFVFGSEIKALLANEDVKRILNKDGIKELFGIGPSHTPGLTYFKDIYEIKPGYFGILKNFKLDTYKYWDLEAQECKDDIKTCISNVHDLVTSATKMQLVSDVGICSMLSGGLDSSILTCIAKKYIKDISTFSVNFTNNDNDFTPNSYQSTKDSDYVKIMQKFLDTNHKEILLDNNDTFSLLKNALISRDVPGMADVDTSMYGFCNKISQNGFKVCLSGECSDEIFGGYPWFYKEQLINNEKGFPWALSENLRNNLLKKYILEKNELLEYILNKKNEMIKNVKFLDNESDYDKRYRITNYLTIKYFLTTLLERTDRMSMSNSLEVRVPFADHRIFEYVYNIPVKFKLGLIENNTPVEKYILRKAFENELPKDVVYRKKSPFPKTYDPNYMKKIEKETLKILNNKSLKIHKILNTDYVLNLITTHGKDLKENLFGQLMTYPQTLAYIYQISMWLEIYNIEIEI